MQFNIHSFIQIKNFHGLFRNVLRCRKTGACRILVHLRYLLSAHSIRFDAHGANYYYPHYAWPSQRRTGQTRKNPTSTHLLHLVRERQNL